MFVKLRKIDCQKKQIKKKVKKTDLSQNTPVTVSQYS